MAVIEIVGVHPVVGAAETCHLLEVRVDGADNLDWGAVTQEVPGKPQEEWQVAWDEREVEATREGFRAAFFFHYLDLTRPLLTPFGLVGLPAETPRPDHLADLEYDEP